MHFSQCVDDRRSQGTLTKGIDYTVLDRRVHTSKDGVTRNEVRIRNDRGVCKWYAEDRFTMRGFYEPKHDVLSELKRVVKKEEKGVKKEEVEEKMTETKKLTLSSFLRGQGVPERLISALTSYRKQLSVDDAVSDRIVKRPSALYIGGKVWSECIAALLNGCNILLEGEKATGKNVLAENLAFAFGRPMWDVSMHTNIDAGSLIGCDTFKDGEVKFRPGSVHNIATYGGFGVLDEINMAKNEALSVLHAVLDDRGVIDVPGYDRIHLHEASRFIGTMNYGYVGTRELNEALVSRFVVIHVPQLDAKGMEALLKTKYPSAVRNLSYFVKLFQDLQNKAKNGEISTRTVDLRGILDALGMIERGIAPIGAVTVCVGNKAFDDFERTKVNDVIGTLIPSSWTTESIFDKSDSGVHIDFSGVK